MNSFKTRRVLSIFTPPASVEALSDLTGSILMFHLKGWRHFPSIFPSHRLRSRTPLTFQFHLAWIHSEVRRTFSGASTCQGCTSPPPLDALRTFNLAFTRSKARRTSSLSCLHSLKGEEDFFSCLKMHESAEGFCTTGTFDHRKTMRSLNLLTTATDRRKTTGTSKLLTIEACNMTLMFP